MSEREQFVDDKNLLDGQTWWELRAKTLRIPAKSWASIKGFIQKVCNKSKMCEDQVAGWDLTVKAIDQKMAP